jgi:hypothetical protein
MCSPLSKIGIATSTNPLKHLYTLYCLLTFRSRERIVSLKTQFFSDSGFLRWNSVHIFLHPDFERILPSRSSTAVTKPVALLKLLSKTSTSATSIKFFNSYFITYPSSSFILYFINKRFYLLYTIIMPMFYFAMFVRRLKNFYLNIVRFILF